MMGLSYPYEVVTKKIKANDLVNYIMDNKGAGGGHDEMAGGFIDQKDVGLLQNKNFDTYVRYRTIKYIDYIHLGL